MMRMVMLAMVMRLMIVAVLFACLFVCLCFCLFAFYEHDAINHVVTS